MNVHVRAHSYEHMYLCSGLGCEANALISFWGVHASEPGVRQAMACPSTTAPTSATRSARIAALDARWVRAWSATPDTLKNELLKVGLAEPALFAATFDADDLEDQLTDFYDQLGELQGETPEAKQGHLAALKLLHEAAQGPAARHTERVASTDDYVLTEDLAALEAAKRAETQERERTRALGERYALLPTEWRGKAYRRKGQERNPEQRQQDEDKALERWSREVLGILMEAGDILPYAASVLKAKDGVEGHTALRCCRGLRANTLKQRVTDWHPLRRWLLATGHGPFPTEAQQLLDYLNVLWDASAPRSAYASLTSALGFFEAAGERPEAERLSNDASVQNAAKELAARRASAKTQAEREAPTTTRQAPQLLVAQVVALERRVVDPEASLYSRFYAWTKLLRHWCSLRWDDTNGIRPEELQRRARGVAGLLERSKTSGPDKATKVLPLFVSKEAWVALPWLETGLHFLENTDLAFTRDYLVPLPSRDLSGSCGHRAQYSDALSLTRQLWASLTNCYDDGALLRPEATLYWTEHSDRAGVTSWLGALGVPKEQRDFLGRWALSSMADRYARTATRIVENLQILAARAAREVLNGGPDLFGEEETLEGLRAFLKKKGVDEEAAQRQLDLLTLADTSRQIPPNALQALQAQPARPQPAPAGLPSTPPSQSATELADEEEEEEEALSEEEEEGKEEEKEEKKEEEKKDEETARAELAAADLQGPPHGFVIAKTQKRIRRLHFVGCCGKVPGEHYRDFEVWGSIMPPENAVDVVCKTCFRGGVARETPKDDDQLEVDTSDSCSSSSSSSSSSAETAPAAKRRKA